MTELAFSDPCVLFALHREAAPFLREFRPHQRFGSAPCWARFGGPAWLSVLVLQSGIGPARMEAALQWLLGEPVLDKVPYRPRVVLSAGFAGALQDHYRVGDVLLATEVIAPDGNRWPATWPGELPPGEWRPPLHRAPLLSVSRLVGDPAEKRELGRQHQAAAVDMESAAVARLCTERGVPFGCVRAVSDDLTTPLSPRLVSLLATERASFPRVVANLVRAPGLSLGLWRLARNTRRAADQLGRALGELLTLTLPFGAEL